MSLPAWGVWIEMISCCTLSTQDKSLPAWGVWIEITGTTDIPLGCCCHSPHGECGLKYPASDPISKIQWSLPAWGVWIEICIYPVYQLFLSSLPAWGVWIEIPEVSSSVSAAPSLPAWGVWIEIMVPETITGH